MSGHWLAVLLFALALALSFGVPWWLLRNERERTEFERQREELRAAFASLAREVTSALEPEIRRVCDRLVEWERRYRR